jgi:hypothetical protein
MITGGHVMPNTLAKGHTVAPEGSVCGFDYYGRKCARGAENGPDRAVHTLTQSLPIAPAGTNLCAYHSPYDVVRRWELTLSPDSPKGRPVHTFTWGRTRREAYARVTDMMDADGGMWDGWSFSLADEPTPNVYA